MQQPSRISFIRLVCYCSLLATLVLAFDLSVPLGIAGGVPYVAVIMITLWSPRVNAAIYMAIMCSALTVIGYVLSPVGADSAQVITNRALALIAIWVTAILIKERKLAERQIERNQIRLEEVRSNAAHQLQKAEAEAKKQRERLAHVDRISAMGEMAASIAHEINQPLTAIATYTEACQRMANNNTLSPEDLNKILGKIGSQAHRAGEVIRRLRTFVKKRDSLRDVVDCIELVQEVVALARPEAKMHNISIELNLASRLPKINVDPVQIQQVILNLAHNGIDSMTEVNKQHPSIVAREIVIKTQLIANDAVEISVRDQGTGMEEETIRHIFDPFYTTKEKGMGMGLAISRSIVDSHGGILQVRQVSPRGSLFSITLPTALETSGNRE